ncbi:MBL fold metallo-hydrolase [Leptolyngbya sp. 7M]|nr:MBL fold metallo-hydrolase [Leptolyngbya sp. 7M]
MLFRQLFDPESSTYTYLIADVYIQEAILVDPVLEQVDRDLQTLEELGVTLRYCLETHIHADHITGTDQLRKLTRCRSIVPQNPHTICADRQIQDGEILRLGDIQIQAIATPGHTDSHFAYLINDDRVLTGDSLLIRSCGRTDFQNGDAGKLYDSITQRLFTLPDTTLVYPGHDYWGHAISTIGEEKCWNPRFVDSPGDPATRKSRAAFIELMANLDLPIPHKMVEAVPANELCGKTL